MPAPYSSFLYNRDGAVVESGTTFYVEVPVYQGAIGAQIAWLDATSSATVTLELTSYGQSDAASDAAAGHAWKDSGLTITGPAASAAGSTLLNVENVRQKRARLKFVTAADSKIQVLSL